MVQTAWTFLQKEQSTPKGAPKIPQMTLNDSTKLFRITARAKGKYGRTANAITDIYSSTVLYSIYQALQTLQYDNGKLSAEKGIQVFKRYIINVTNTIAAKMRQERKGKFAGD